MRGRAITWTEDELRWIKRNSDLARAELRDRFAKIFGRDDISTENIKALCSRNGWSAGPAGKRRHKGKSLILTEQEAAWLRANARLSRRDLLPAFQAAFPDSAITLAQLVAWRKRNGLRTGRDTRFAKGQIPWSKGRKIDLHPNAQATQFAPGQTPHNTRPIGYERLNQDGYVLICVDRPNPWKPGQKTHMAFKHKELWVAAHGPIPKGHVLKCLDGDKTNCAPSNWEAVPQGLLPRLNGKSGRAYDAAPAEVKPTIMAIAKLEHAARAAKTRKAKTTCKSN